MFILSSRNDKNAVALIKLTFSGRERMQTTSKVIVSFAAVVRVVTQRSSPLEGHTACS